MLKRRAPGFWGDLLADLAAVFATEAAEAGCESERARLIGAAKDLASAAAATALQTCATRRRQVFMKPGLCLRRAPSRSRVYTTRGEAWRLVRRLPW